MMRVGVPRRRDEFEILSQIGKGTYGLVHKAVDKLDGSLVALKQILIKHEREGFPVTAIREIKILRQLKHPNIVDLLDVVCDKDRADGESIFIVFEFCMRDLAAAIQDRLPLRGYLSTGEAKWVFRQILEAVAFCHSQGVFHRDLKLTNILLTSTGQVKVGDFGLAKHLSKKSRLTNRVVTRWYRPPELLFGAVDYGAAVDVWSAGFILGELLTGRPLFPGDSESEMIFLISELLGVPDERNFPGVSRLLEFSSLSETAGRLRRDRSKPSRSFNSVFSFNLIDTKTLIKEMLKLDPALRPSAEAALRHAYWEEAPRLAQPEPPPFSFEEVPFPRKRKSIS